MFKDNFVRLCNQRGESPTVVCKKIGITSSAFSKWTDESIPRKATLMRIADYFGVTIDNLLALHYPPPEFDLQLFALPAEEIEKEPNVTLSPKLEALIDGMTEEELADLERYAEFIMSRKKGK